MMENQIVWFLIAIGLNAFGLWCVVSDSTAQFKKMEARLRALEQAQAEKEGE